MADAIVVDALRKDYGDVRALDGLSLTVAEGSVLGLLGPNGAGKTTAVRILATLLRPDAGTVEVCGIDALRSPQRVRPLIGLTGQYAAVDEKLTGFENLRMLGRLFRLGRTQARQRADELLEGFGLAEAAGRPVRTYSGGMRRRLDLAASLIARPRVVFLDEPTTGLDPRSRAAIWRITEDLVAEGTTVLLTTQYLEEADRLAEAVAVIDQGRVIARGTPDELKNRVGGERVEIGLTDPGDAERAQRAVRAVTAGAPCSYDGEGRLVVQVAGGASLMPELMREFDTAGVAVADLAVRRPTLDDVFLSLTGRPSPAPGQDTRKEQEEREAPPPDRVAAATGGRADGR
ncbi:ATP-binding cassette domain-containing protein [Wenjunlia tyrosinilytica]|uniref:ABC-type xenobiotic transporter n=1 Tax=Wenjunlia tyrosinilytica TaxID=1544741 RepID=A0A918DZ49_9ACTN|nr:ATP-binding cassette domain-containing protein [Wenjunlia tyrosinilytica]GGO94276.1 daunorubicin resistance protein DrrA family ABC transporter ATP-binding protein [Wenjunlia tyrosinilytica]